MIRTAAVIATLIFAATMGTASADDKLINDKRLMLSPAPPAMLDTHPMLFRIRGGKLVAESILSITKEGRIFWKGREVETDDELRAAMIGLAKAMGAVVRAERKPCGKD